MHCLHFSYHTFLKLPLHGGGSGCALEMCPNVSHPSENFLCTVVGVVDVAAVPQSPLTPRRARHPLLTAVPCQTCHSQRARGERAGEVAPSAQPSWCRLGALDTLGNISPARRRRSRRGGEGNTSGSFGRERRMPKKEVIAGGARRVVGLLHQAVHRGGRRMSRGEIWN